MRGLVRDRHGHLLDEHYLPLAIQQVSTELSCSCSPLHIYYAHSPPGYSAVCTRDAPQYKPQEDFRPESDFDNDPDPYAWADHSLQCVALPFHTGKNPWGDETWDDCVDSDDEEKGAEEAKPSKPVAAKKGKKKAPTSQQAAKVPAAKRRKASPKGKKKAATSKQAAKVVAAKRRKTAAVNQHTP